MAAEFRRDELVAYLQSAADPKMLRVCEIIPLRIDVVSSGEAPTLTDTS